MFALWINDRPLDDLVRQVLSLDGHLAPAVAIRPPIELANSAGTFGTTATVAARTLTIGCDVRPSTYADRQSVMDAVKARLSGLLEIRTGDLPDRVLCGLLQDVRVEFYSGAHAQLPIYLELRIVCPDPARRDVEPLLYALSTARVTCPIGTEASAPMLWVYGSCTNPVVIVRSHAGDEVGRMTCTTTLGANDALVIDTSRQQIDRYLAGVRQTGAASGLTALTSGVFPILSPADSGPGGSIGPTVELQSSSGTPTGLILYHRRW